MTLHDMKLFSFDDVREAWDDAATRIIPLASIDPIGKAQIREYFIDILMRRSMQDDSFPEYLGEIEITPIEQEKESE